LPSRVNQSSQTWQTSSIAADSQRNRRPGFCPCYSVSGYPTNQTTISGAIAAHNGAQRQPHPTEQQALVMLGALAGMPGR
jgi:hypothetical protein